MALAAADWIVRLAAELGTPPPDGAELDALLGLAGVAAHASERIAAPVSCWLVARAGVAPSDGLVAVRRLAEEVGGKE